MTAVTLYQDIATFLAESPEWVENWLALPVKKRPASSRTANSVDFMVNFFKSLPIYQFNKNLKINRNWYKECARELVERRKYCIKKYWKTIEEYKETGKVLEEYWETEEVTSLKFQECMIKRDDLIKRKYDDFEAWIEVDKACLRCGFPDLIFDAESIDQEQLITHKNPYYYINMFNDGLDPYEVPSPEALEAWNRGEIYDFDEYEEEMAYSMEHYGEVWE